MQAFKKTTFKTVSIPGDIVRADLANGNQYKITDILGEANDIGVENLAAAGMIAGETAKEITSAVILKYLI